MKKIFIIAAVLILIVVSVFAVSEFSADKTINHEVTTTVVEKSETETNVDGWLKITEIYSCDGKLAVKAENVSDEDIEYALLAVKTKNGTCSFNISALLSGTKAVLICNESENFDPDEIYTGWKTENVIAFEEKPMMNEDEFEIRVADSSIAVISLSEKDITSDILIYYKEKTDGLLNGSVTHRIRVTGLKSGSQTYVNTEGLNADNCQIIFTEYGD